MSRWASRARGQGGIRHGTLTMGNDGRSRASTAMEVGGVMAGLLGGVMAKLDNMIREYGTAHRRVNWACMVS